MRTRARNTTPAADSPAATTPTLALAYAAASPEAPPHALAPTIDLRRRADRRTSREVLLQRAEWLEPEERALIRAVYHEGVKIREIASVSGLSHSTVRSRIRRVYARIDDPRFSFVLAARDGWPAPMRRVATACYLRGHTLRRAASELKMSIAAVRRYRDAVAALYESRSPATDLRTGAVA